MCTASTVKKIVYRSFTCYIFICVYETQFNIVYFNSLDENDVRLLHSNIVPNLLKGSNKIMHSPRNSI